MPKIVREKVGEIHRVKTVKTFGDKVAEFLGGLFVVAIVITVLVNL